MEVVDDGLEGKGGAGGGAERVLGGGEDLVLEQVVHELVVDEGVEDFRNDGEEGDGSVVCRERFVFCFVHLNDLRYLKGIRVLVLVNGLVV